jgi:hypothetical protein
MSKKGRGSLSSLGPPSCPYSPKCSMALDGPPRSHENGLPPSLFSHQCLGDLANNLATPRLSRDRQNGFLL